MASNIKLNELVTIDTVSFNQKEKRLELREQLLEITEQRKNGSYGIPAKDVSKKLRERIKEKKRKAKGCIVRN